MAIKNISHISIIHSSLCTSTIGTIKKQNTYIVNSKNNFLDIKDKKMGKQSL